MIVIVIGVIVAAALVIWPLIGSLSDRDRLNIIRTGRDTAARSETRRVLANKVAKAQRKPLRVTHPTVHLFDRPLQRAPKDLDRDDAIERQANAIVGSVK